MVSNHSWFDTLEQQLSDSVQPVRTALRYSYQSWIVVLLYCILRWIAIFFRVGTKGAIRGREKIEEIICAV